MNKPNQFPKTPLLQMDKNRAMNNMKNIPKNEDETETNLECAAPFFSSGGTVDGCGGLIGSNTLIIIL